MSSKYIYFKDNVKPAHWVGHSQLRFLDIYDFLKRTPGVDEKQAIVTVNTTKQSVSGGRGENPVLLQEEENVAEETNYYADVNSEANKSMIKMSTWLLQQKKRERLWNIKKQ